MRVPECVSMLLFLLCACVGAEGVSGARPALLRAPSTVLLEPCTAGDSSGMEAAGVSRDWSALAAAVSMRGAARTSPAVLWLATLVEDGVVRSVSVVVAVERLLDEEGSAGAEKVLDTADWTDSCEAWCSVVFGAAIVAVWVVSGCSAGAMAE
jgi:hypothetical protein